MTAVAARSDLPSSLRMRCGAVAQPVHDLFVGSSSKTPIGGSSTF